MTSKSIITSGQQRKRNLQELQFNVEARILTGATPTEIFSS